MEYLQFEGSFNVGKTNAIIRFAQNLVNKFGYMCVVGKFPPINSGRVFQAVLEKKKDKTGKNRVIVNSPSDITTIIDSIKSFCDSNPLYDVIISSCRKEKYLYNHFFKLFLIFGKDKLFELPLAKINHRASKLKTDRIKWIKEKIDKLAEYLFLQL